MMMSESLSPIHLIKPISAMDSIMTKRAAKNSRVSHSTVSKTWCRS